MADRRCDFASRAAGFSIVELAIVVIILAVVMAAVIPVASNSAELRRTQSATQKLSADLALARAEAVRSQQTVTVKFNVAQDSYRISAAHELPRHVADADLILSQPPYEVDLISADFDGQAQVEFDAYGQASAAGAIQFGAGDHVVTISVDQESGRAQVD
jgi:Tfp pilus assembly protein FimT